ncbi:hypothetical protein [Nonlabens sp. SY33080]|uniref:hypothetical protein n=1 Tax=Nonlabens sp. SY33080 TaxID=2719911 RepID=UPI001428AA18|nr:hypothetical protein [Nonlabens sp. SY33080]
MKEKRTHILSAIVLAAIYVFGIVNCINTVNISHVSIQENNISTDKIESVGNDLFAHATPSDSSIFSLTEYSDYNDFRSKTSPSFHSSLIFSNETKARVKQYTNYHFSISFRYRKSDLIFPFHYFW